MLYFSLDVKHLGDLTGGTKGRLEIEYINKLKSTHRFGGGGMFLDRSK